MSSRKSLICLLVSLFVIICYLGIIVCLVHLIPLPKVAKNLEDFEVETIFKIVFLWVLFFFLVVKALKENSNCPARYQIKSIQKSWQERIQALLKVNQEFGQLLLDHYMLHHHICNQHCYFDHHSIDHQPIEETHILVVG